MVYTQVCPVLYDIGAFKYLGDKVKELGCTKVLGVYDSTIEKMGLADQAREILKQQDILFVGFNRVVGDCPVESVNEGGAFAREQKVDCVVGIGGGSAMDTAKAISVLVTNPPPIQQYYIPTGSPGQKDVPLILVPTSAGTGSEATAISVIYDQETGSKQAVMRSPSLAILDPELTVTAPPSVTAACGMDILAHAIECYTTNTCNPKSDLLALDAIKRVAQCLPAAFEDGSNIEARSSLLLASNFAGTAFGDANVHIGHAIAHAFGTGFHIPHGEGCAIALPEVILLAAVPLPDRVMNIAQAMGVELQGNELPDEVGRAAARKIVQMIRKFKIKTLKERGISLEQALERADAAMKEWFIVCAPQTVDVDVMRRVITDIYNEYPNAK